MSGRGLLKSALGVLFGACTTVALLPILLIVPKAIAAGILIFVLGGTVILSVTAQDVREAVGRSLVTLGSALAMLPVLSLSLGVLLAAPLSVATAKGDKSRAPSGPSSQQVIAACVAFGAGSLVAMAGLVIMIKGQRGQFDLGDRAGKTTFSVRSSQDKVTSGVLASTARETQTPQDSGYPEAGDQSGMPSKMNVQERDSQDKEVSKIRQDMKPFVPDKKAFEADARTKMVSAAIRTLNNMSGSKAAIGMVGAGAAAGRQGSVTDARPRKGAPLALPATFASNTPGKQQSAGPPEPISKSARTTKHPEVSKRFQAAASAPRPASGQAATQIRQADPKKRTASSLRERLEVVGYSLPTSDPSRFPASELANKELTS